MPNEAITAAVKSIFGEYASPEKIRALDAALRPIYGWEVADTCKPLIREIEEQIINPRDIEISRLRSLLAFAEEALKPFAEEANCWRDSTEKGGAGDSWVVFVGEDENGGAESKFCVGDLRTARTLAREIEEALK